MWNHNGARVNYYTSIVENDVAMWVAHFLFLMRLFRGFFFTYYEVPQLERGIKVGAIVFPRNYLNGGEKGVVPLNDQRWGIFITSR